MNQPMSQARVILTPLIRRRQRTNAVRKRMASMARPMKTPIRIELVRDSSAIIASTKDIERIPPKEIS